MGEIEKYFKNYQLSTINYQLKNGAPPSLYAQLVAFSVNPAGINRKSKNLDSKMQKLSI